MENNKPTICVFCGSSLGNDAAYAQAARRFGTLLAGHGYDMVFGGGAIGLMGETARSARDGGASVHGVLPAFLRHLEHPLRDGEKLEIVADLHLRKARMIALADAFVLLPGGLGTMDEFMEALTAVQLGVHAKPIVMIDVRNYFAPIVALISHFIDHGFAEASVKNMFRVTASPEEAISALGQMLPGGGEPAFDSC